MSFDSTMLNSNKNSCGKCEFPDNKEMVSCDDCHSWFHFSCVNVTAEIEDHQWSCKVCVKKKASDNIQKALSISSNLSGTSSERRRLLELQRLEEERALQECRDVEERVRVEAREKRERYLQETRDKADRDRRILRDKEYLEKKYNLLEQEKNDENDSRAGDFIEDNARRLNEFPVSQLAKRGQIDQATNSADPLFVTPPVGNLQAPINQRFQANQQRAQVVNPAPVINSFMRNFPVPQMVPQAHELQPQRLTANQIAARHVASKDLPNFAGNPEDWPLFISCYQTSTETCCYSDSENMIRLQRCLKGRALEAVRSKLLLPSMVPDVIRTLKMLFGRAELIIHSMLQKIRAEPPPKADKLETIVTYAISVQNLCATMEVSGLQDHLCNPSLLQELSDKLPPGIKLNWAIHKQQAGTVTLTTLGDYLYNLASAISEVTIPTSLPQTSERRSEKHQPERGFLHLHSEEIESSNPRNAPSKSFSVGNRSVNPPAKCLSCGKKCLKVSDCAKFKSLSHSDKWDLVREKRLCKKCFGQHNQFTCKSRAICGTNGCTYRHHPLLHNEKTTVEKPASPPPCSTSSACNTHQSTSRKVLFRIVPVKLYGESNSVDTFAFLDEGSEMNLLEEGLANDLGLIGTPENLCLRWTSNTVRVEKNSRRISLEVSGTAEYSKKYRLSDVRTVKSLDLPIQSMVATDFVDKYPHLGDIPLEDYVNAVPRLIIGMMNSNLGLALEYREGSTDEPIATRTRLGWIVHGVNGQGDVKQETFRSYHICDCTNDNELHTMMKDFFSTEGFGVKIPESDPKSKDDQRAEEILESTTKKLDKRFETGLIWKYDQFDLPDSLSMAKRRLFCLEKKMQLNPDYADQLKIRIKEYESKGYARKLSVAELSINSPRNWYLPVFTVTNPNKPGKFRMVFDAAAQVNGVCLNTVLLKGPDQLEPLPAVLYRFRERRIGISGDIREMFHQIRIRQEDQNSQRFLWRDGDSSREPDVFVMQVMTFGATCSPSSAQYVKNRNAQEWSKSLPRATIAITQNHYVDDWLDSVDSEYEAIKLAADVKFIHSQAGFEIRNFISNSSEVLKSLNDIPDGKIIKNMNICPESDTEKVLGMWWNTASDTFTYSLAYNKANKDVLTGLQIPSKREVLRTLMSIFDPLGLLSFFLVYVKILLQEIWRSSVDWDQPIGLEQNEKWLLWIKVLPMVETLQISRCYSDVMSSDSQKSTQLHIFVDASENAFAAVAYFRIESRDSVQCVLVGAKNRVAPQKPLSIPRLELQAAVLGTRLATSVCERHSIKIDKRYFWSDSKTVLYWLKSDPRKYRQFVAFRLGEALETTKIEEWRWVPTKENVADEATKWNRTPNFSSSSRWFVGPQFLQLPETNWPENIWQHEGSKTEEVKPHFVHFAQPTGSTIDVSRFSRWVRLVRAQAFVLRFIYNSKPQNKVKRRRGPLSSGELSTAESQLYKLAQSEAYPEEFTCLKNSNPIARSSLILNRSPYIDDEGVMRMKGRIDSAVGVSAQMKRPVILPKDHPITRLIVDHYHHIYHHVHAETVVNELQQKYSIPKIRVVLKSTSRSCQRCKIQKARPAPPEMSDLPSARLASFTRPFSFIGIDYFGPITVSIGRRIEKRWGVLITCLTIRAVHIEVAHSLNTESCIMALRNFIARRGTPVEIYCDNGTNFHGADNELRKELANVSQSCLQEKFTSAATQWIFNPPASPHMGGSWERLIRSVKKILYQLQPSRHPSDELLRSLFCEIENIINSRPLTYIALESSDHEALTPNHFLLGSSSGLKPPGCFSSDSKLLGKHWKTSQQLATFFWKRWVHEYLPTLTRRTKWFAPVKPIEKGDIVVIVDEKSPTNCWPKGVVIDTVMGKNNQVRQATVQTCSGVLVRPAVKLAVLDVKKQSKVNSPYDESTGR